MAAVIARAERLSLVVLIVEVDGLFVTGTDKADRPPDVPEQRARLLTLAEPTGDAALVVSVDSGLDGGDEAVRRAYLDVQIPLT